MDKGASRDPRVAVSGEMVSLGGGEVVAVLPSRRHRTVQDLPYPVREFHVTRGASGVEIHFEGNWLLADIDRSF